MPMTKAEADARLAQDIAEAKERHAQRIVEAEAAQPTKLSRSEAALARRLEMLEFKRRGLTPAEIGRRFGVTPARARDLCQRAEKDDTPTHLELRKHMAGLPSRAVRFVTLLPGYPLGDGLKPVTQANVEAEARFWRDKAAAALAKHTTILEMKADKSLTDGSINRLVKWAEARGHPIPYSR